jgi:endoglucanase
MKKTKRCFLKFIFNLGLFLTIGNLAGIAQLPEKSYIRIDQFGYLPEEKKFAVIAKAESGFNAGEGIIPSTTQPAELRKKSDNSVVYSANVTTWNGGITETNTGDKGWWFDFSSYVTAGEYYIRVYKSAGGSVDSYPFKIDNNVYKDVLKAAVNMFYYQRCEIDKTGAYASGSNWTDTKWYIKDRNAISASNSTQTRDLSGGWIDAGDPNKYSSFTGTVIHDMLTSYEQYPTFWKEFNLSIPESANTTPDLLDEIKWEIDWLKKMQLGTAGSYGAFIMKMGIRNDDAYIDPPSIDSRDRYYSGTCPQSTIIGAGVLAHVALVFKDFPEWATYAADLKERAEAAWTNYQNSPNKSEQCLNEGIKAGDGNGPGGQYSTEHLKEATAAAVYLFALTGKTEYHDFFKNNYTQLRPFVGIDYEWGMYRPNQGQALMFYTTLANADITVKNAIIAKKTDNVKSTTDQAFLFPNSSLYRNKMAFNNYGSNSLMSTHGADIMDYVKFNLRPNDHAKYKERALGTLNYMHGLNPLGACFLTNMYQYGGDLCTDEMWHTWFDVDSRYDNIVNGNIGPAPGFLVGGINQSASGGAANVKIGQYEYAGKLAKDQPTEKEFSNKNSESKPWEYCEPAIYYQTAYIRLLSHFVANNAVNIAPASVDVTPNTASMETGLSMSFNAVVTPSEASQNVTWLSSNTAVATVNSNGLVTSLSVGTTYIKATTLTGNKADSTLLTVIAAPPITSCNLIENPGFESNFLKWDNSTNGSSISASAKSGTKAAVIDLTGGLNYATKINVPSGFNALTLKAWAKTEGSPSTAMIGIDYLRADNSEIAEDIAIVSGTDYREYVVINNKVLDPATAKVQVWTYKNGGKLFLDDFCLTASMATAIRDITVEQGKIYPNPVNKEMMVPVKANAGATTIKIVDMKGRTLTSTRVNVSVGQQYVPVNTEALSTGNYIVHVIQGNKQTVHKIVKAD